MTHNPVPPRREKPPRWQIGQLATLAAVGYEAPKITAIAASADMPGTMQHDDQGHSL